jgi:predicted N-acetyltransferase YhbS
MAGYELRDLRPDDATAAAELIRRAFANLGPLVQPPPSALRETAESVGRSIADGGGQAAMVGSTLIGVVLWEQRDGGLYFGRLAVDAAHRRRGIAQALVAAAETHARACGYPRLHAAVRLVLIGNRALFASLGFVETRRHAHDGFTEATSVEVEKQLV